MKPVGKRGGPFPYAGEQICLFDLLTFRCFWPSRFRFFSRGFFSTTIIVNQDKLLHGKLNYQDSSCPGKRLDSAQPSRSAARAQAANATFPLAPKLSFLIATCPSSEDWGVAFLECSPHTSANPGPAKTLRWFPRWTTFWQSSVLWTKHLNGDIENSAFSYRYSITTIPQVQFIHVSFLPSLQSSKSIEKEI